MRNYIANLFDKWSSKLEKAIKLDEYDLIERGWKRGESTGAWLNFTKAKYTLKLEPKRFIVSLKYNKAPRFYGIIETARGFDKMMELNNKYFKK